MNPTRVQRRRTKGWRTPLCSCGCGKPAIYVGRPTKWGNPYHLERRDRPVGIPPHQPWCPPVGNVSALKGVKYDWPPPRPGPSKAPVPPFARVEVAYRHTMGDELYPFSSLDELTGHDLMCWCPPPDEGETDWCHAAILLELANPGGDPE